MMMYAIALSALSIFLWGTISLVRQLFVAARLERGRRARRNILLRETRPPHTQSLEALSAHLDEDGLN